MVAFVGTLFYYNTCYHSFHCIPNIFLLKKNMATKAYKCYETLRKSYAEDDEDDVKLKIPNFKGA